MRLFSKLIENRNLLKNLIRRELKGRYAGSAGGFIWSVIHPLTMLVSYSFVAAILQLKPPDGAVNFPIFLFCGIVPWTLFTDTVLRSCGIIVENKSLITKTIMPAEMLPVAITLSNLVHHAIGLGILLTVLVVFHTVPLSAIGIVLYLPILILFAQGLGWLVSGLQVFLRDTLQAIQILLFLWQWFTPLFYSLTQVHEPYRTAMMFNPMAIVITGYRNSLLGLPQPDPLYVATAAGASLLMFVLGGLIFRQAKPAFADVL